MLTGGEKYVAPTKQTRVKPGAALLMVLWRIQSISHNVGMFLSVRRFVPSGYTCFYKIILAGTGGREPSLDLSEKNCKGRGTNRHTDKQNSRKLDIIGVGFKSVKNIM